MVINMKILWMKQVTDNRNFELVERLGMNVYKLENPEEIDKTIENAINKNYKTIILTNELASFSEDIIKKYTDNKDINIIISKRK